MNNKTMEYSVDLRRSGSVSLVTTAIRQSNGTVRPTIVKLNSGLNKLEISKDIFGLIFSTHTAQRLIENESLVLIGNEKFKAMTPKQMRDIVKEYNTPDDMKVSSGQSKENLLTIKKLTDELESMKKQIEELQLNDIKSQELIKELEGFHHGSAEVDKEATKAVEKKTEAKKK